MLSFRVTSVNTDCINRTIFSYCLHQTLQLKESEVLLSSKTVSTGLKHLLMESSGDLSASDSGVSFNY